MKTITDIKPQTKTPTRCNIYLDNTFYCGLELQTVMRFRLKIGDQIDPDRLDEIQCDSERTRALDKAMTLVSKSRKTKKQVADYLFKLGYTPKTVEEVLEKMEYYRFVDDGEYATDYARYNSKRKGKYLIEKELRQKGVSQKEVSEAIEELGEQEDEALLIAQKYMRNKEKNKQNTLKCYKYLLSKGFSYETAKSASVKVGGEDEDDCI